MRPTSATGRSWPRQLGSLLVRLRGLGRRHRLPITIAGSLVTAAALAFALAGRRHQFAAALSAASVQVLGAAVLLQIVALLARTEAWHRTVEAAGGTVAPRVLYRASSMQVLGSVINGQLGVVQGSALCADPRRRSVRRCRR